MTSRAVDYPRRSTAPPRFPMTKDPWDPAQYRRFQTERAQPFEDLLALVQAVESPRVADLGCGTGELTTVLHRRLAASETVGLDSSAAMLERAAPLAGAGVRFERATIAEWLQRAGPWDVLFSNAALQWCEDHEGLFGRLAEHLTPGGQLAVQMPANHDHPSHTLAAALAREEPFATLLGGYVRQSPVRPAEWYATLLHRLGFLQQHVRLQVYGHLLGGPEEVLEWVKGTLLTGYRQRLLEPDFDRFIERYRERLLGALGSERPHFYPFKRLLLWARR